MSAFLLSVVVPTHGRAEGAQRALEALAAQALPGPWELVVVDDASPDGTWAMLQSLAQAGAAKGQGPHWRLLRLGRNHGRAGARQQALRAARGPLVVFVDDDVVLAPGALAAHLKAHARPGGPWLLRGRAVDVAAWPPAGAAPPRGPAGALAFVTNHASAPSDLLKAAGGFDLAFTAYGWEDLELGERLQALGGRLAWARGAEGWHVKPPPTPADAARWAQVERERGAMAAAFWRRHPTWAVALMIGNTPFHAALAWLCGGLWWPRGGEDPGWWGAWVRRWPDLALPLYGLAFMHLARRELLAALSRPAGQEGLGGQGEGVLR